MLDSKEICIAGFSDLVRGGLFQEFLVHFKFQLCDKAFLVSEHIKSVPNLLEICVCLTSFKFPSLTLGLVH